MSYSFDLIKKLVEDLREDQFTSEEITNFRAHGNLRAFRGVIRGTHEIRPINHMIDLSVPCKLPFPEALSFSPVKTGIVKLERRGDDLCLDGKKIELFLSEKQKGGSYIVGHDLWNELEARGGNLSASVLDHLEAHPELWPESWKKDAQGNTIYVFFWDDIFRLSDGYLHVRYGGWVGGKVVSYFYWLDNLWDVRGPAASLAS